MKRLAYIAALALLGIVGCKQIPKRTVKAPPPPPPLPTGASFKRLTSVGDAGTGNGIEPTYVPTDFALTSIRAKQNSVVLTWQNGAPPFQPQSKPDVLSEWMDFGPSTMQRSITNFAPYGFTKAFFRVKSIATTPGQFQWSRTGFVQQAASPRAVAVDSANNVVMSGTYNNPIQFGDGTLTNAGFRDNFLVKYSNAGKVIWSRRFGNEHDDDLQGHAMDASGNTWACGGFQGTLVGMTSAGSADIFIAKYSSSGSLAASFRFGGALFDSARAITVAANGDVYFTALFSSPTIQFGSVTLVSVPGLSSMALVKMNSAGTVQWAKSFASAAIDAPSVATVGGDVYMTGNFHTTVDFGGGPLVGVGNVDIFLTRFNGGTGALRWSKSCGSTRPDRGLGIAVGNNVVIAGQFGAGADFGNGNVLPIGGAFLASYDLQGSCQWAFTPNFISSTDEAGQGVTLDGQGNIFWTGKVNSPVFFGGGDVLSGNAGAFIASMTGSGVYRWAKRSNGAGGSGISVAVDAAGHVNEAGFVINSTMFLDQTLGQSGGTVSAPLSGQTAPWVAQFTK